MPGPSSPIIEVLKPVPGGLNISWRTDVTSKQEKYVIIYTRNDTGQVMRMQTTEKAVSITELFPGAGYQIQVYAVSHGLQSEPHDSFQSVPPLPPLELRVVGVVETNVSLAWVAPSDSLYTEFLIRWRARAEDAQWREESVGGERSDYTLQNMDPGEMFSLQLDTASYRVVSGQPLTATTTIDPSPVSLTQLQPILEAENVTVQWPVPAGRVERYYISWHPVGDQDSLQYSEVAGDKVSQDQVLARVLLDNLRPGLEYRVEVITESHGRQSRAVRTNIRTKPLCTSALNIISHPEVAAITLSYTPTPPQRSTFDTYRFMLSDPAIPVIEKAATDADRKVTFVELVPGRLYNITMWTVSGEVTSRPVERQDRLHPQPVSDIEAVEISDQTITLTWNVPLGEHDSFELTYLDAQERLIQNFTNINSITIGGLRPFKNYTFTVVTKAGSDQTIPQRSTPISAFFTTKEGVPGSLSSFEPIDIKPNLITFRWSLPDRQANGVITGYTIQWGTKPDTGKLFIPENSQDFSPRELQGTISDLKPGQKYTFQIKAKTKIGFGPHLIKEQKMPILAPPTPAVSVFPTEVSRTMHTVTIRFRKNYFSDENGAVLGYSIIVAEDYTKATEGDAFLPGWVDVQKYSTWPPFQVMDPYDPFNKSSDKIEDFTIGTEDCLNNHGKCNGKLKPGTIFRFKVRHSHRPTVPPHCGAQ